MSIIQFKAATDKPQRHQLRIAVAVDDAGNWLARGGSHLSDYTLNDLLEEDLCELQGDARQQYWLLVDVPLPPTEVLVTDNEYDESPEVS